jgi:hypothetical protein
MYDRTLTADSQTRTTIETAGSRHTVDLYSSRPAGMAPEMPPTTRLHVTCCPHGFLRKKRRNEWSAPMMVEHQPYADEVSVR